MNANKFLQEYKRLCDSYNRCAECPLYIDKPCSEMPARFTNEFSAKIIKAVEDWSAANPVNTRATLFKKIFPNVRTCENGSLRLCPHDLDESFNCPRELNCFQCRTQYWFKEVQQ